MFYNCMASYGKNSCKWLFIWNKVLSDTSLSYSTPITKYEFSYDVLEYASNTTIISHSELLWRPGQYTSKFFAIYSILVLFTSITINFS